MAHLLPKMWKRAEGNSYYVRIGDTFHNLGRDRRQAKAAYTALMLRHGLRRPQDKIKLSGLIDAYLQWTQENKAPSTYVCKKYRLDKLRAAFENVEAGELNVPRLTEYMRRNIRSKSQKGKKQPPSPTTINTFLNIVSHMYTWGMRNQLIENNPFRLMEKPACRKRDVFLTKLQLGKLLGEVIDKPHLHDFILFQVETGARAQEMFRICAKYVHDLDGKTPRIVLPAHKSKKGRTKKRIIFVPPIAANILRMLVKRIPSGPLFLDGRGLPYDKASIGKEFAALKERLKIKGLCSTVLRHTFAHNRLEQGQSMEIVAKLMGHSTVRMVFERYGHMEQGDFLAEQASAFSVTDPPAP